MLPKARRISRSAWKPLIDSRKFAHSEHFMLKTAPGARVQVAVSVSKKVARSAVVRNRTRRRAYSAIRSLLAALPSQLYLLSAKPGAEKLRGAELVSELGALLKKS